MNKYLSSIFALFCLFCCSACAQQPPIYYYSSNESSYIVPDLFVKRNKRVYPLLKKSEPGCYSIESQQDFDGDGNIDVLMGDIIGCGGNCCANAYFFFLLYNGRFVRTKSVGNGEYIGTELFDNQLTILIHSYIRDTLGIHRWVKERYALSADSILHIATYYSEKIKDSETAYTVGWDSSYYQPDAFFIYKVEQEGLSLWELSVEFKTNIEAIKTLNNLLSDVVYLGNQLKIPQPDTTKFHLHTLQVGETLWRISQDYKVPVDVIQKANKRTSSSVRVGETLKIPKRQ